jgi:hypothetical protein
MKALTLSRFDALAGYIRSPESLLISRELEWYADDAERVLGVLLLDLSDQDFGGVVLGKDARRRYRAVSLSDFCLSRDTARNLLQVELEEWSRKPDSEFWQGDEKSTPMDIFAPVAPPVAVYCAPSERFFCHIG